ncbi:uncharacterized protein METZ01_LOCUS275512, partial [marine metagenome]
MTKPVDALWTCLPYLPAALLAAVHRYHGIHNLVRRRELWMGQDGSGNHRER